MRKHVLTVVISIVALAFCAMPAMAFHDAGVAYCSGCHTMHNSENGAPVDPDHPNGNLFLLKKVNGSEVCLSCHSSGGRSVWASDPLAPGNEHGAGNFVFLGEDNVNDGHAGGTPANWIPGYRAGHNVIAPSKNGGAEDPTLHTAPGGTYPSSSMGCTSCHNPHGNEHFRLLYGQGVVKNGNYTFNYPAPTAAGVALSSSSVEGPANHTAYQGGMSAWCANCHGAYHDGNGGALLKHPAGVAMSSNTVQVYNLYRGTGQPSGGASDAYTPLVAFEDGAMTVTSTAGPGAGAQVSCISCHRAHATSGPNIGRWDFAISTFEEEGVESGSFAMPNPYPAAGIEQRSLCNKCHAKDAGQ